MNLSSIPKFFLSYTINHPRNTIRRQLSYLCWWISSRALPSKSNEILGKYTVFVDWSNPQYSSAFIYKEYEPEILSLFKDLIKLDYFTLIDAGANWGHWAVLGGFPRYIGIEPNKKVFKQLQNLIKNINYPQGYEIYNEGLWYKEEKLKVKVPFGNSGIGKTAKGNAIDGYTLDRYLKTSFCVLKLDIEGIEIDILENNLNLIHKYQPAIVFEDWCFHNVESCHRFDLLVSKLRQIDYLVFVYSNGILYHVKDRKMFSYGQNFITMHKNLYQKFKIRH